MTETDFESSILPKSGNATAGTASRGADQDDNASPGIGEEIQGKADEVRQKASDARGAAAEEVQNVVGTAKEQARGVLDDLGRVVDQEANDQSVKLAQIIDSVSEELEELASNGSGMLSTLAQEAAPKTRSLARWVEQTSPRDMLQGVEDVARRQPMLFILGCAAAGVVAGRLTRGLMAAGERSDVGPSVEVTRPQQSLQGGQSGLYGQPGQVLGAGPGPDDGRGTWGAGSALAHEGESRSTTDFNVEPSAAPRIAAELQDGQVPESGLGTGIRPGEAGLDFSASEPRSEQRPQADRRDDL